MMRLQRDVRAEQFFGELLQQRARNQTVEVAFVGEDHIWFWQGIHGGGNLIQLQTRGEPETDVVFLMAKWTWRCLFKGVRTKPSNSINQHEYCRRL
jgi:hypothetical protein